VAVHHTLGTHKYHRANQLSKSGICAGKSAIASFLIREHGFRPLHLDRTVPTPAVEKSESNANVPTDERPEKDAVPSFSTADGLLDFVTASWNERWLTTDVWDESVLDVFLRRPFFLLVSVDAPVTVRWARFTAR
jgi:dCMP deaminase